MRQERKSDLAMSSRSSEKISGEFLAARDRAFSRRHLSSLEVTSPCCLSQAPFSSGSDARERCLVPRDRSRKLMCSSMLDLTNAPSAQRPKSALLCSAWRLCHGFARRNGVRKYHPSTRQRYRICQTRSRHPMTSSKTVAPLDVIVSARWHTLPAVPPILSSLVTFSAVPRRPRNSSLRSDKLACENSYPRFAR